MYIQQPSMGRLFLFQAAGVIFVRGFLFAISLSWPGSRLPLSLLQ
jgi:hypothetical protein